MCVFPPSSPLVPCSWVHSCAYDGVLPVANKDPAARKYAEWTGRAASKDGIEYELREVEVRLQLTACLRWVVGSPVGSGPGV